MKLFGKKGRSTSQRSYGVVTGAGSGIGRSFAKELAKRGGTVVCSDINLAAAEETVAQISQSGGKSFAVQCDVSQADQVKDLAEQAELLMGHPTTLIVNNAGVGLGGEFEALSLEDWQWCIAINLWGVIHGCHYFIPRMQALGYGAVINVASAASYTAAPEMSAYNVSKAGVMALSETLSVEMKKHNIKVNVLCPTMVPTNIIKNGRIPGRYSKLADHALMNYAMTTSDKVVNLTLNQLDKGELYTTPQLDAKTFWLMKRASPKLYAKFLALSYQFVQ